MRIQLTPVQRDVVQAYSDWMEQKKQEIQDYFNSPDTPKHYKEVVLSVFKQLDKDDSGIVQLDELLAWAAEKNPRQGSKVPDDFIIAQFTRVDLDGSGGLDFNECLLLQYLGCLNMLWCGCCGAFIDMDKEDGVTCASCYGKFGSKDKPGERQLDLCIKCYDAGKGEEHAALAGHHHYFVRLSEIKTPETVTCMCCGTEHAMVLGYMQGHEGDRHVRPVPGNPDQWLCELCALASCKCGDKLAWDTHHPEPGALFRGPGVLHEGGCSSGRPSLKERWVASNATRRAPHCKGCKEALLAGTMPFPEEPPEAVPLRLVSSVSADEAVSLRLEEAVSERQLAAGAVAGEVEQPASADQREGEGLAAGEGARQVSEAQRDEERVGPDEAEQAVPLAAAVPAVSAVLTRAGVSANEDSPLAAAIPTVEAVSARAAVLADEDTLPLTAAVSLLKTVSARAAVSAEQEAITLTAAALTLNAVSARAAVSAEQDVVGLAGTLSGAVSEKHGQAGAAVPLAAAVVADDEEAAKEGAAAGGTAAAGAAAAAGQDGEDTSAVAAVAAKAEAAQGEATAAAAAVDAVGAEMVSAAPVAVAALVAGAVGAATEAAEASAGKTATATPAVAAAVPAAEAGVGPAVGGTAAGVWAAATGTSGAATAAPAVTAAATTAEAGVGAGAEAEDVTERVAAASVAGVATAATAATDATVATAAKGTAAPMTASVGTSTDAATMAPSATVGGAAMTAAVAMVAARKLAVSAAAQTSTVYARQAVCICCQDVHDLTSALDGGAVKGYLFAGGFPEHIKRLEDGTYVCEWCAKYACEKCGSHYADVSKPSLAKWSRLRCCPPSECCEATKWGGLASVRAGIRKKADDMGRGHCRTCRQKIMTETLMDLSMVQTPRQDKDSDSSSVASTVATTAAPPVQQTVVCFCCQEVHDVTSALNGSRVPAYVHKDDFAEHTKVLVDGRFLCEWCSKWKCHRCGALKWTDRPQLGLWSVSTYYCKGGCKPKEGGPHVIEKSMLRASAYDLGRAHCRTCREKIITGKLTEIAPSAPQKPVSGGGAPPPSKQTNVGKVLNLNSKDESSCSIQ